MNEVKTPKRPLIFYYCVAMLILLLFNFRNRCIEHRINPVAAVVKDSAQDFYISIRSQMAHLGFQKMQIVAQRDRL